MEVMDDKNETTHEEEVLETLKAEDIQTGNHLNVIPFQFIKLAQNVPSEIVEVESNTSEHSIATGLKPFESVRTKYSKYYKQTYRTAWENMPDFKGWLKGVKGQPTRAYCTYCQKTLHAHRLSLLKHTCTIRHQKAAQLQGGSHSEMDAINTSGNNTNIQTMIVSEDNILTEQENTSDLMHSTIVYASQEEIEQGEHDLKNDLDQDDSEDYEEYGSVKANSDDMQKEAIKVGSVISTHVIDNSRGAPVIGLSVSLYKLVEGRWTYINEGVTDTRGRSNFFKNSNFTPGRYKLHYDVDRYFDTWKQASLFPFIETVFDASSLSTYHFPLLLGPNSYTTYRSTQD